MNITKCQKCHMSLIVEEATEHECREFTDLWAIDGRFWIGDGVQYYPVSPTKMNNQGKQPDNEQKKTLSSTVAL